MTVDYPALAKRIASLTEGETDSVALMATVACELHHSDARFDWTGFYRVTAPEMLKIGPYQGDCILDKPSEIPIYPTYS